MKTLKSFPITPKETSKVDDLDDGGDLDKYDNEEEKQRKNSGPLQIWVHDVIIKGNIRKKYSIIEADILEAFNNAYTFPELLNAARIAHLRLRALDVFKGVSIKLIAGSLELPGMVNVIIEVVEPESL